jgi:hypothetical protein
MLGMSGMERSRSPVIQLPPQQRQQEDDRNRNSEQPKQDTATHDSLRFCCDCNVFPARNVALRLTTGDAMPERPDPQPMTSFDPTQPVMVHEQTNDVEVEWVPVTKDEWESGARWHDAARTAIVWKEMLLDRWWPAGEESPAGERQPI